LSECSTPNRKLLAYTKAYARGPSGCCPGSAGLV
jgi:hypothetical protein